MTENRRYKRSYIALKMDLQHPSVGNLDLVTRDMSDGGVFLLMESTADLQVGDLVRVRSKALGINGDEVGQNLQMRVVRKEETGIGLSLMEVDGPGTAPADPQNDVSRIDQSVQQSLLLVYQGHYLLLRSQGDHWRLPCYALASKAHWRAAQQQSFTQLWDDAALNLASNKLIYVDYCYPQIDPGSQCMDLMVPAFLAGAEEDNAPPTVASDFAWFTLAELEQLDCPADKTVIDKVLKQGLELQ